MDLISDSGSLLYIKLIFPRDLIIIHQTHISYGFDYYTSNSYFLWIWFQTAAHYYTSNSYFLWIWLLYIKLIFPMDLIIIHQTHIYYGLIIIHQTHIYLWIWFQTAAHYYTSNSYFLWIWLLYIKLIFPMDLIIIHQTHISYGFDYYTSNSYFLWIWLLYIKLIFPMDLIIIHQTHIS